MRPRKTVFNNSEIPGRIHAMLPFLSEGKLPDGTRRWSGYSGPATSFGHLPRQYRSSVRRAVYVVYSYGTPIGWVREPLNSSTGDPYWFTVPDVGYSPTTGTHQYACLEAWADHLKYQGTYRRFPSSGRETVQVPGNAEVYGTERRLRAGGVDGHMPGSVVTGRRSAYEDTGDDASHWSPPNRRTEGTYPGWNERPGYRHPSHP